MLRIDSKNMNLNGTSVVNDETVATFSASVNDPDPNMYFNINVTDKSKFNSNLTTIQNDTIDFMTEVAQIKQSSNPT